jgi:hypothetical protein
MSSFVRFVLKHKKDNTPWGDVARDVAADGRIQKLWNWKRFKTMMEAHIANESAWKALEEMAVAYKRIQYEKYKAKPKPCMITDE